MADTQNCQQKYTQLLPSIYTFFGLIFQKLLTCIRNTIILHVYYNLKCNENWWKAAHHASSIQHVVSYAPCVWYQTSEFCTILPGKLITSNIKIFVQNKIFSRPTDPTFWTFCYRNQTIIFVQPYEEQILNYKFSSICRTSCGLVIAKYLLDRCPLSSHRS